MENIRQEILKIEELKFLFDDSAKEPVHLYECVMNTRTYPILNEYINLYLKQNPNKIDKKDKYGYTALMFAARTSKIYSTEETVKILLENGANVNIQNNEGCTALILASRNSRIDSSEETVRILLKHDANVNIQDNKGWTALMSASSDSKIESSEETVKILLEHGANVNIQDNKGWTALMLASSYSKTESSEETVKILLEHGANINLQGKDGCTALIIAASDSKTGSSEETVRILLENGANVNIKSKYGWSALMFAAKYSKTDSSEKTVRMLLEHEADPNVEFEGVKLITILYDLYLENKIDVEIIGLLISFGANYSDLPVDKNLKNILKEKGYLKSKIHVAFNYLNRNDVKISGSTCQICFKDNVKVTECDKEHKICFNCIIKVNFNCEFCHPRN